MVKVILKIELLLEGWSEVLFCFNVVVICMV